MTAACAAGIDVDQLTSLASLVEPDVCQVFSFKHSSAAELQHDFLWRTTRELPERGRIAFSTGPYYEEVLIVRDIASSPRRRASGRAARRQDGLAPPVSFNRGLGETSP